MSANFGDEQVDVVITGDTHFENRLLQTICDFAFQVKAIETKYVGEGEPRALELTFISPEAQKKAKAQAEKKAEAKA